jgi:hypothetical protein
MSMMKVDDAGERLGRRVPQVKQRPATLTGNTGTDQ